jgi:hypothetical protein
MAESPFAGMLDREIGATPEEYLRGLKSAFPKGVQSGPFEFEASTPTTTLRVAITPMPRHCTREFAFPRLAVHLSFSGGDPYEQRALLDYMDRMMLRGGG